MRHVRLFVDVLVAPAAWNDVWIDVPLAPWTTTSARHERGLSHVAILQDTSFTAKFAGSCFFVEQQYLHMAWHRRQLCLPLSTAQSVFDVLRQTVRRTAVAHLRHLGVASSLSIWACDWMPPELIELIQALLLPARTRQRRLGTLRSSGF